MRRDAEVITPPPMSAPGKIARPTRYPVLGELTRDHTHTPPFALERHSALLMYHDANCEAFTFLDAICHHTFGFSHICPANGLAGAVAP